MPLPYFPGFYSLAQSRTSVPGAAGTSPNLHGVPHMNLEHASYTARCHITRLVDKIVRTQTNVASRAQAFLRMAWSRAHGQVHQSRANMSGRPLERMQSGCKPVPANKASHGTQDARFLRCSQNARKGLGDHSVFWLWCLGRRAETSAPRFEV